jgi:phage shock protein PspC (stress-responsive transcriptional regulator)
MMSTLSQVVAKGLQETVGPIHGVFEGACKKYDLEVVLCLMSTVCLSIARVFQASRQLLFSYTWSFNHAIDDHVY